MSTVRTCPECGSQLPPGAVPWLCPNCLLAQAAGQASDAPAVLPPSAPATQTSSAIKGEGFPQRFGSYELLERLGQGGMGLVYKARQISLDRLVALKVLPLGALATKEQVLRFRTEAAAAGSLQHPNIVAIHEVGLCEDRHYLVMDFVEGQTLAELARAGPLPPTRAARYVQKIAEAIHYAHERGILHRDLKPSNVLVDAADEPRVTDFGLAKRLDSATDLTVSGQVLGSPQYMPPEQAAGRQRQVGRQSDVYSLGAILYHLLTGRPPFVGETLSDILPQAINEEPLRPRQLNPAVPADLETTCLKCLEKDMPRRYPSALALAEELGRFLRSEPIVARPVGVAGRVWRWCRRKPQVASLTAVAMLTFLVGFAGVLWQWREARRLAAAEAQQRQRAEAGELSAQRRAYLSEINSAQQALNANNPGRALELLNRHRSESSSLSTPNRQSPSDFRGFEWRYLWQQCQSEAEAVIGKLEYGVRSLDVSSDGQWLFAGSSRAAPKVWNLATGEEVAFVAERAAWGWGAFSPDSRYLLIADQGLEKGSYGTISVWDLQTRKKLAPIIDDRAAGALGFSSDGRRLGYLVLLNNECGAFVALEFASRQKICELVSHTKVPDDRKGWDWAFSHDGRSFIGSDFSFRGDLCLWELMPGSKPQEFPAHSEGIIALAISPDGSMLATAAGYTETGIKLWEVPSFRPLGELVGHQGWITGLKFSPDGQTLASAAADQTIRLWDVATRKARRKFGGLPADAWRVCFSRDGRKLFSGSADGTIHRWSVDPVQAGWQPGPWRLPVALETVVVAPDARRFAGLRQGGVWLGQVEGTAAPAEIPQLGTNNTCLLFSRDGQSLFAGTQSGEIQIWALNHPQPVHRLRGSAQPVNALRQDQQGHTLVVIHWRGRSEPDRPQPEMDVTVDVQPWRTDDWLPQRPWTISGSYAAYAVSSDGRWLAADAAPGTIQVRSLSGPPQTNTLSLPGAICGITFSPDGRILAAATSVGTIKVWEVPRFSEWREFRARPRKLSALAFSPDSQRLATAGEGADAIKLWDVATWQELISLPCEGETLREVFFSADGNQLIAKNSQGDLLFWRTPSFAQTETAASKTTRP